MHHILLSTYISWYHIYSIELIETEHKPHVNTYRHPISHPYCWVMGSQVCEEFGANWLHYKGTALCVKKLKRRPCNARTDSPRSLRVYHLSSGLQLFMGAANQAPVRHQCPQGWPRHSNQPWIPPSNWQCTLIGIKPNECLCFHGQHFQSSTFMEYIFHVSDNSMWP